MKNNLAFLWNIPETQICEFSVVKLAFSLWHQKNKSLQWQAIRTGLCSHELLLQISHYWIIAVKQSVPEWSAEIHIWKQLNYGELNCMYEFEMAERCKGQLRQIRTAQKQNKNWSMGCIIKNWSMGCIINNIICEVTKISFI